MGRQKPRKQSTRTQRRQEERQIAKQEREMATPPVAFNSLPTIKDEPDEDDNPEPATNGVFYTEAMRTQEGDRLLL